MRLTILIVLLLPLFVGLAKAGEYSEFYVEAAKPVAVDPAVNVLRKTAFDAARRGGLAILQSAFADKVTIYAANIDPSNMENDKFKLVEKVAREKVVARIAEQVVTADEVSKKQLMRSGLFAVAGLLRDPEIGANGKMDGMICNRPVNLPNPKEFKAARTATKSRLAEWVVAKQDMGPSDIAGAPGQYPTKFYKDQMVLQTNETHGDNRWTSIAALNGGDSLFYQHPQSFSIAPFFARYVAQHVCFGKENGRWKITAIALRVQ